MPKLMDAYNQRILRGTDDAAASRLSKHWDVPGEIANRCTGCRRCEEACTQHLPVVERLRELGRPRPGG